MTTITQKQFDDFKALYPHNLQIQALTLTQVLTHAGEIPINWKTLDPLPVNGFMEGRTAYSLGLTDCQKNVGYVIFDVICLALGAVGLRSKVNGTTIEAIFYASAPAMSRIELIIADMSRAGTSVKDYATGVLDILKTIYSGGCLGAVISAFLGSLTWWDMILYGTTALATIVAALVTDGIAFVAEVIILLASFGFLASDSAKAVQACSLPSPAKVTNGMRINDESNGKVYVGFDGTLRYIPNVRTYNNLFADWSNIRNVPNVNNYLIGTPITDGASLVKSPAAAATYLLLEDGKHWITSPTVFNQYGFSWPAIRLLETDELNAIPTGDPIN